MQNLTGYAFAPVATASFVTQFNRSFKTCPRSLHSNTARRVTMRSTDENSELEEFKRREKLRVDQMRTRLEGLFGTDEQQVESIDAQNFDGAALRAVVRQRWGVEYDIQPQKRGERVYVQVRKWRFFCKQQSPYLPHWSRSCGDFLSSRAFT
eukprot:TRINITY_DN507_c0_g1_i3.p1 TRINITY_DN507_c0_g1~~TRINITY_DN507_c0_g1_i3.p1  ORF type:complete len:152 (+),score=21.42 TRINITY_DN507_c0_g1_i3:191-646(+)